MAKKEKKKIQYQKNQIKNNNKESSFIPTILGSNTLQIVDSQKRRIMRPLSSLAIIVIKKAITQEIILSLK